MKEKMLDFACERQFGKQKRFQRKKGKFQFLFSPGHQKSQILPDPVRLVDQKKPIF